MYNRKQNWKFEAEPVTMVKTIITLLMVLELEIFAEVKWSVIQQRQYMLVIPHHFITIYREYFTKKAKVSILLTGKLLETFRKSTLIITSENL